MIEFTKELIIVNYYSSKWCSYCDVLVYCRTFFNLFLMKGWPNLSRTDPNANKILSSNNQSLHKSNLKFKKSGSSNQNKYQISKYWKKLDSHVAMIKKYHNSSKYLDLSTMILVRKNSRLELQKDKFAEGIVVGIDITTSNIF